MKNSKIILLYKIIIITLIITLGITYYKTKTKKVILPTISSVKGYINNIKIKNEKIQIELISDTKILVDYYIKDKTESYNLGDEILVEGIITLPSKNTIFNLFNYRNYLLSKNINYIMQANNIVKIKKNNKLKYKLKNMLIEHINGYKSKDYLKTFILGDNNEINENIVSSYQSNGISHLFAVSGMHLSLFSGILLFILKKFKIKEHISYIIICIFFIFFAFLTNHSSSVLRALLMYIFMVINKIFDLKVKTIYIIILTFSILLLYNPFYIYNVGFLFSFTVCFFIIIFNNIINSYKNYFSKLFITSLIAFLSSIPIMIQNFFIINLITPINNIFFVPLISFVIFPLTLLTLFIKPLDIILKFIINILENLSIIVNKININITLGHMPSYIVIIYYILIIIFIKSLHTKNIKNKLPLIVMLIIHQHIKYFNTCPSITTLDIGQGDSILIELSKNKGNILIDTGGNYLSNNKSKTNNIIDYIRSLGINRLNYLILTHGDFDHMGEAINLVNNFKVEKVIFNCGEFNDLEKELIKVLDKKKIKYYSCIKELNIDKNKLYFLQTKEYDNENDNSNVIYTELNGYKFMFMGDASITTEKEILNKYNLPDIDVLKVGHHGSKTSSDEDFIHEINPKYSVISVGKKNRYGHPNKEVLNNLNKSKIYRTDMDGSIMFRIKNNKLKIETCSP